MTGQELQPVASGEIVRRDFDFTTDVQRVVAQKRAIHEIMKTVMKPNEHYGVIEGCKKPSLLQPGADVLGLLFRLAPKYEIIAKEEGDKRLTFDVRCTLEHIQTHEVWGEGLGSATTDEDRYYNQLTAKLCPKCHQPAIAHSKNGGWFCWAKKGGCGAEFAENDETIQGQTGQLDLRKMRGLRNTIVKMAAKRAHVAATRTATAASDIFSQDLEDLDPEDLAQGAPAGNGKAAPSPAGPVKATPIQIRDLNLVLSELKIGAKESEGLRGAAKETAVFTARLAWVNGILKDHNLEIVKVLADLLAEDAEQLIKLAKACEMPKGPA